MTTAKWTVSSTFLGLMAVFLGIALLMMLSPQYGRYLVFPFVLFGWLISLCLHEYGHAVTAYVAGDHSVVGKGYLSLDPLRYTDLQFSIVFPLIFLALGGIGLPGAAVYLDTRSIRSPLHLSLISAGGPLATLAVLILLLAALQDPRIDSYPAFQAALTFLAFLEISALILTLLPVPGLDGWGIIEPWLPANIQDVADRIKPIGPMMLFAAFLLIPSVNALFWRYVYDIVAFVGLKGDMLAWGWRLFQFWR